MTDLYLQEADSKDFKAQLKTKDDEVQHAKKNYECQLAKVGEKSRLLSEKDSKLANQKLESELAKVVKLQADNQLLQQSSQIKEAELKAAHSNKMNECNAVCLQKVQDIRAECSKKMDEMKDNFQVYSSIRVIY